MWNLESLKGLSEDEFELERRRIIDAHIKSLPLDRQPEIHELQRRIDAARASISSEEFLKWLAAELAEQFENLSDACSHLGHLVDGPPKRRDL